MTSTATVATATTHNLYQAPLSSYESLDKFNCTAETLKITDDYHQQKHNLINTMNPIPTCEIISTTKLEQKASSTIKQHLQASQIQSMNNNYKSLNSDVDDSQSKSSSMRRHNNGSNDDYNSIVNTDDNEMALNKQKHLSDWYYIKTSPKPKPTSPYERRKVKNFHPSMKTSLQPNESYNNRNSSDKINSLNDESPFIPIQKYRSNDYIVQNNHHFPEDDKSPLQAHKCFSMKYSRNSSGIVNETKFGEMTSSSFEHVNVMGLYDNRFSENDLRNEDYVQSLRIAAAKMRPLPQAPTTNNQESQVC